MCEPDSSIRAPNNGTYFEAFMLAGLLCIAAALMVLFIGTGRHHVAEPVTAKAYS
jgi:hypothetical protein